MKRAFLIIVLFLLTLLTSFSGNIYAQAGNPPAGGTATGGPEYAVCDACGYCKNTKIDQTDALTVKTEYIIPDGWESCRSCLYPGTSNKDNPDAKETVLINPATGRAPTPATGHYNTSIGCISTSSFRQFGSASGLVQTLLNLLFGVAGGIAFLYIMYGAFVILTSRADPEKLNYGKRLLVGAVVGLIFSLGAVFIINFLGTTILKIPGFSK